MPSLALYQPEIPQNAGTILRMCACFDVSVHIIEPASFPVTDRAFRRAGLDYLAYVAITRHLDWTSFSAAMRAEGRRLVLATTKGGVAHTQFGFQCRDVLIVGRETSGVPPAVHAASAAQIVVPMRAGLRSLNVAVAAAIILGEALRQCEAFPSSEPHAMPKASPAIHETATSSPMSDLTDD